MKKIHSRDRSLLTKMKIQVSWENLGHVVHDLIPDDAKTYDVGAAYGRLWSRVAAEFLEPHFEAEYNSLKHGMRSSIRGFAISISANQPELAQDPSNTFMSRSEYGSSFWNARRFGKSKHTFETHETVSHAWSPKGFAARLSLLSSSINNVVARLRTISDPGDETISFSWPEQSAFDDAWKRDDGASIMCLTMGSAVSAPSFFEQDADVIRDFYKGKDGD